MKGIWAARSRYEQPDQEGIETFLDADYDNNAVCVATSSPIKRA